MTDLEKKRLKVVIFVSEFSPLSETFIYNQVNVLQKDHDLYVVCIKRMNEKTRPFEKVKVIDYEESILQKIKNKVLRSGKIHLSYRNPAFAKKLDRFLFQIQPDLIHCHFGPNSILLIDNWASSNTPIIITFHGYDASYLLQTSCIYRKRMQKILKRKNIYSLFVSKALLRKLQSFGVHPQWAKILYLGIDNDFFKRRFYQKNKPFTFLQVSRFVEKKGHSFTLKAFHQFLQKNPHFSSQLILAGDGPLKAEIIQLSKTLGIFPWVKFIGSVNHEEVRQLLETAHVFLHHSVTSTTGDTEGIPTVIMEAMSMELPVISTYHSGIPELILNKEHGLLVKERDVPTYSLKMTEVLSWGYKKNNRDLILSQFGNKVYIESLINIYKEILSHDN